jgi:hypothetical protein
MKQFLSVLSSSLLLSSLAIAAHLPGPDKPSEEFCRRNPGSNFCSDVIGKTPISKPQPGKPEQPINPPYESKCQQQIVKIVLGKPDSPRIQCAPGADGWEIPYIYFNHKSLSGYFTDRCPEILKETLSQSQMQNGLNGTFTECIVSFITPEESNSTEKTKHFLKISTLLLENKIKFESESSFTEQ